MFWEIFFNNFFYFWTCLLKWEVCCLVFASFFGIPFHCKRHKKLIKNKEMLNIVSSKTTTCVLCPTGCVYQNNITQTHTHIQGILIMRRCSNKNITTKSEQNPPPFIRRAMRYRKRRNKNPTWLPKNTEKKYERHTLPLSMLTFLVQEINIENKHSGALATYILVFV